jgi:hypothetical protein
MEITKEKIATLRMELLILGVPLVEIEPSNASDTIAKWKCNKPFMIIWISNSSCKIVSTNFANYIKIEDVAGKVAELFNGDN